MKRFKALLAFVVLGAVVCVGTVRADPSPSGGGPFKPCATCMKVVPGSGGTGK